MPEMMLGIINPDGYEKVNRVYSPSGDCPTITARDYKDPIKILDMRKSITTMPQTRQDKTRQDKTLNRCRIIGQMDNIQDHTYESANRVYDKQFCCPTIPTSCGGGHTPKVLVKR